MGSNVDHLVYPSSPAYLERLYADCERCYSSAGTHGRYAATIACDVAKCAQVLCSYHWDLHAAKTGHNGTALADAELLMLANSKRMTCDP